jgi:ketosteroid isomerase-like protein
VTPADFAALVERFSAAATAGDGTALAACFTPNGTYFDYIYGPHVGRASIKDMLENLFHRDAAEYDWSFYDPVVNGDIGYAHSLSTFLSKVPDYAGKEIVIDGMSRFVLKDGLIAEYHESVNGGVAHAQLGLAPERIAKVMARWSKRFRDRGDVESYRAAVRARYAKGR